MQSNRAPILRSLGMATVLGLCTILASVGPALYAQGNSAQTWQTFQVERNDAPGTYITFQPPTTPITPYTLVWPSEGPNAQYVFIGRKIGTDSVVLDGTLSSQYILELVSSGQLNIRRAAVALEPGSPQATPGYISNDFQGSRTSSSQTATGDRVLIMGGAANRATGSKSSIGGGNGNATTGNNGIVVGGQNNNNTGSDGAILGGTNNALTSNDGVLIGGYDNDNTGNRAVMLGGNHNSVTGNQGFIGGGYDNSNTGDNGTLFGGYGNKTTGTHCIIWGGWTNTVISSNEATITGGYSNTAIGNHVFIGAGYKNSINSGQCVILSGDNMTINGNQCVGLGGRQNQTGGSQNILFGGQTNVMGGNVQMTIGGGYSNNTASNGTVILGGQSNTISGQYATIMGGKSGTTGSAGYNTLFFAGDGANAMTIATYNQAVTRNTDVMMATNDNTPRTFKFFESNGTTGNFPGASTNFVGFKAPGAMVGTSDHTYTLPDRMQTSLPRGFAIAGSPAPSSTAATTEWATVPIYTVTTVAANAATTNLTTANLSIDQPIKLNPNNTPANRRVTLANGNIDGFVVTLYVRNATAANGIRLKGTDVNLALAGTADADLDQNDSISLIWDNTSTKWIEIGRSVN